MAGTFLISGNTTWHPDLSFPLLYVTLFDIKHGLFPFVPWTIFGFAGCSLALAWRKRVRWGMLRPAGLAMVLYLVLLGVTPFGVGDCYGPRYWVPFLPWLALAAVEVVSKSHLSVRFAFAVALLLSLGIAIPGALRYMHLYDQPVFAAWRR